MGTVTTFDTDTGEVEASTVFFSEKSEDIEEAVEKVKMLTARRDGFREGTRDRAVQQIMLDWWTKELASLISLPAWARDTMGAC